MNASEVKRFHDLALIPFHVVAVDAGALVIAFTRLRLWRQYSCRDPAFFSESPKSRLALWPVNLIRIDRLREINLVEGFLGTFFNGGPSLPNHSHCPVIGLDPNRPCATRSLSSQRI